ncbi:hypothetical protein QFZ75_007370 [Streptomyces sp. V3I8]|nr:hypothetical protein [Streptomyces sp. V3I8]
MPTFGTRSPAISSHPGAFAAAGRGGRPATAPRIRKPRRSQASYSPEADGVFSSAEPARAVVSAMRASAAGPEEAGF